MKKLFGFYLILILLIAPAAINANFPMILILKLVNGDSSCLKKRLTIDLIYEERFVHIRHSRQAWPSKKWLQVRDWRSPLISIRPARQFQTLCENWDIRVNLSTEKNPFSVSSSKRLRSLERRWNKGKTNTIVFIHHQSLSNIAKKGVKKWERF